MVDFIYLKRDWEKDRLHLLQSLASLMDHCPLLLLIFPEGTTISKETLQSANEFQKSRGLPLTKHSLQPKATGLFAMVQSMDSYLDGIYDLTLVFSPFQKIVNDENELYGVKNSFFRFKFPREIHYLVDYIPADDIPKSSMEQLRPWLTALFQKKEKIIENFEMNRKINDAKLVYKGPMLLSFPLLTWLFIISIDIFWFSCIYLLLKYIFCSWYCQ